MLTDYITLQLNKSKYKILEDESYFGEIPGISGVWANAKTLEKCRAELQEVLEDWLLLQVSQRQKIKNFDFTYPELLASPFQVKSLKYA